MKKLALLAVIASLLSVNCGDKILTAKTAVSFVAIGVQTARSAVEVVVAKKRAECLKLGAETANAFKKCFAETETLLINTNILWVQLDQALLMATAAIKAAEQKQSGQAVDYATPIKTAVCLLTKLALWLPAEYQAKIRQWLSLASAYTCNTPVSNLPIEHQRELVARLRVLLLRLGARG